jgi:nicotinamide-nucleotide amidase
MIQTGVIPYLRALSEEGIYSHNIYIIGMGESAVEDKLHDMMLSMTNPTLAPYAKDGYCLLRLTAKAATQPLAEEMMAPVLKKVLELLGDVVYGVDVGTIEQRVVALASEKKITIATAESCTGGLIAKRITDVPGASSVLTGGMVTYTNRAKTAMLGIDSGLLDSKGAVCRDVALLMAENAAKKLGADIGIGTTGVAGPGSDEKGNPVGLVYIGLYYRGRTWCTKLNISADRDRVRNATALTALDMARRAILDLPVER